MRIKLGDLLDGEALARRFLRGLGGRPDPPLLALVLVLFGPFGLFERDWGECLFCVPVVSGCVPVFCEFGGRWPKRTNNVGI